MRYDPVTEKPYCCVPAIFQMIQARRGLPYLTQDEIGWELGLIVPAEIETKFTKVRTGAKPRAGYGTRTSEPEFSIEKYFNRNNLSLSIIIVSLSSLKELISTIRAALNQDNDVVLCFNSQLLFGDGDREHVPLIEEVNEASGAVTVVDPAIGVPKRRATTPSWGKRNNLAESNIELLLSMWREHELPIIHIRTWISGWEIMLLRTILSPSSEDNQRVGFCNH